ncbi:uncharacterized protein LOC129962042 [Argiope bruennichi]|uniref:uncharacterized protein LOC129962042 n=1 Tax=Argiope bruennichi TaxID=94029 RepID=UPI0024951A08|nr:uncharacterized protein LOC129962042 [Argiope bruennichi]
MQLIKDFAWSTFVTLFIFTIVESSPEVIEEKSNCTYIPIHNGTQTGSFSINFEQNCDIYTYQIKYLNESSIIKIKSVFTDFNNLTNSKSGDQRVIQVLLKEFTTLTDGTKSLIVVNQWNIDLENDTSTDDTIYYSRTADLIINVEVTGNWSNCVLNFFYEEVEFKEYRNDSSDREGKISPWISMEGRGYRPNSVYVFQILKSEVMNVSSIHLIVNKLQIDEGMGEYLLVGAGKEVFQGPPPLFISSSQSKKKIKINDENAYIVFVAASTRSRYSGFEIIWKHNGTRITRDEDTIIDPGIVVDESHSMPICIHNISAALNELNNSEDSFGEFRERLASLGTEYAYNNSKNLKIDSSQVHIVRVSAVIGKKDILYVMVKIQHAKNGKAIFTWNQLGHILKEYSSRFSSEVKRGYWIKHCTEETHQRKWANIIIYAIAPVLCCICLLIWNWRNTPFSRIFSKKIKMAIIRSKKDLMAPEEDNEYVSNYVTNTVPKVRITNDEGRRYTWNNDEGALSSGAEQDSDIEVFNRRDLRRSSSSLSNTKVSGSARSSSRSLKRPEINMAFKNEECIDDIQNIPETSTPATEHAYDTVNSQKSLLSTNSTFETKL